MVIFLRLRFAAFCFFLTICVSVAQAPVNDECAGALEIQAQDDIASTVSVPANFSDATLSAGAVYCGTPSQGASDLWFRFTAHHPKYILDSYDGAYAEVFQGDCDNLQLVYCKNGVSYLDNLVPETEYFLRLIVPWPDLSLNFRLVKAPDASANDLCSNALPLTSTGQPQNLVGANLEGVPLPSGNITTSVLGDVVFFCGGGKLRFCCDQCFHF